MPAASSKALVHNPKVRLAALAALAIAAVFFFRRQSSAPASSLVDPTASTPVDPTQLGGVTDPGLLGSSGNGSGGGITTDDIMQLVDAIFAGVAVTQPTDLTGGGASDPTGTPKAGGDGSAAAPGNRAGGSYSGPKEKVGPGFRGGSPTPIAPGSERPSTPPAPNSKPTGRPKERVGPGFGVSQFHLSPSGAQTIVRPAVSPLQRALAPAGIRATVPHVTAPSSSGLLNRLTAAAPSSHAVQRPPISPMQIVVPRPAPRAPTQKRQPRPKRPR